MGLALCPIVRLLCMMCMMTGAGDVVGGADSHLPRLRRLPRGDHLRQADGVAVRGVRRPRHGAPHPHRGGQLRRLLQRAEEDRGQGAQEGGPGQAGRV